MDPTQSVFPDVTRTADPDATVGHLVGDFAPTEEWTEIGRGAMGVVYKATQPGLNRAVAVKMLLGDDAPRHALRFLAEAEAVAAVDHPNVVKVYEFGRRDGRPFLAMEFLPGGTLSDKLSGTPLPPADAATLIRKIAFGVGAAHAAGVIHRDLKPSNVLFDSTGEPKVTDFGLAKRGTGIDLTNTQAVMGTPAYMSPEQAKGDTKFVGPPADVWAIGVILFEALTGTRPFTADDTWGMLQAVQHTDPPDVRSRRREVPRDLSVIVAKCLRKEPAERYTTANELAADLGRWLAGESILARPPGSVERALKWAARKPAVAAGWALGVIAAVSLVVTGVTLKLKADADAARGHAEVSEGEAKQARDAEQVAREQAEQARDAEQAQRVLAVQARVRAEGAEAEEKQAKEQLARGEYARTVNLAYAKYQKNDLVRAQQFLTQCREDLRGWEWHFVHRLCNPECELIPERIASTDQPFSADGRTFLTLKDGKVGVRHVEKGLVRTLDTGKETKWATISPDAGTIATGDGKTCRLWKATGAPLRELKHAQDISSAVFSADGVNVLGVLRLPDWLRDKFDEIGPGGKAADIPPLTVTAVWKLAADGSAATAEWRADAKTLSVDEAKLGQASGPLAVQFTNVKGKVAFHVLPPERLIPLQDGRVVSQSPGATKLWSADGKTSTELAVGAVVVPGFTPGSLLTYRDGALSLVAARAGNSVWDCPIGAAVPTALSANPNSYLIAVGCEDGRVEVWTLAKERKAEFRGFSVGSPVTACRLSGDGRRLVAAAGEQVRVWRTDRPSGQQETEVQLLHKVLVVNVTTTGERPRSVGSFHNTALQKVSGDFSLRSALQSSNDLYSVFVPDSSDLFRPAEGARALRERTTARRLGPHTFFDPERARLWHNWQLWPTDGGRPSAFSLDNMAAKAGTATACHHRDDLVAEWDAEKGGGTVVRIAGFGGAVVRSLAVGEPVAAAAFARTGRRLYVATASGGLSAWDTDTCLRLWAVPGRGDFAPTCLDVSPDGRRLATNGPGDGVRLIDAATGAVVTTLRGHKGEVKAVRHSPDGTRLASHGADELKLWDPATGQELFSVECPACDAVDFSPGGDRIVTTSADKPDVAFPTVNFTPSSGEVNLGLFKLPVNTNWKLKANQILMATRFTERAFDARPVPAGR